MTQRIVGRETQIIVIAVGLGALVTTLLWLFGGPIVGGGLLAASIAAVYKAVTSGFVLDDRGLQVRPFFALTPKPVVPWQRLQSVDVDDVMVGVNENRQLRPRVRFMIEGAAPVQLIGCPMKTAEQVLERVRAAGLPATDSRDGR